MRPHNDAPGQLCCRSCRRFDPARPVQPEFRALLRTHRSRPSVDIGGRHCTTCRIHQAGVAIVHPCAPSTSCLRNSAYCPEQGGIRVLARGEEAGRSPPTPRPSNRSVHPSLPPNESLESKTDPTVSLCPRALVNKQRHYSACWSSPGSDYNSESLPHCESHEFSSVSSAARSFDEKD